jgi:signal transduction histidine kinase
MGNSRILVVDDDLIMREVLRKQLESEDYEIRTLPDGRQVIDVSREWRPDLILLDVVLPDVSGTQLCVALRSQSTTRHIPILMLTSLDRPADVVQGLEAGASDYVCKPFNAPELRARIATHLRTGRIIRELADLEKHLSLGRLTSGLCHEVNNPLTVVLGQLEMLANELADPRHQKFVRLASESARRIHKLIQGLREYAEPLVRPQQEIDVNAIMTKAISIASLGWVKMPIQVEAKLAPGLPPVLGDAEKLQQVFINILTNASQVMPHGGTIVAETGTVRRAREWVFARVSDTGKGIADANLKRIFDPFWTTKENWQSPGLGLSVARRIVDEHQGTIEVESEEGTGSTFLVLLPSAGRPRVQAAL